MKFICQQSELIFAVNTASRAVALKSTVPVLEGLLIETVNGDVKVSGYDLKTGIVCTVQAEVIESGSIVINARLFGEIIRRLPDNDVVIEVDEKNLMHITCGMAYFEISVSNSMDYPDLPEADGRRSVRIKSSLLKDMLARTNFAVSYDDTRPIQTGSLFDIENGELTIVAVDGFRLALRRETLADAEEHHFVVPGPALVEVERIAADDDSEVVIYPGDKHVMFNVGPAVVICRRLEGEFLDYKRSIPKSGKYYVTADRAQLISMVERVALIINTKVRSPVRCSFGDNKLNIVTTSGVGHATDECEVDGNAENLEIGFNDRYLLDILKAAPADEVRFQLTSSITPCVILPVDPEDNSFVYMILPVRLKAREGLQA